MRRPLLVLLLLAAGHPVVTAQPASAAPFCGHVKVSGVPVKETTVPWCIPNPLGWPAGTRCTGAGGQLLYVETCAEIP